VRTQEEDEGAKRGGCGHETPSFAIIMSSALLAESDVCQGREEPDREHEVAARADAGGATSSQPATAATSTAARALAVPAKPWQLAFDGSVPPSTNALATAKSRYSLDPPGFDAAISKEPVRAR
jgi:hypothetical protein